MKRDLASKIRCVGLAGLLSSLVFYILAVDGAWYRADGIVRLMAETHGLVRWRFVAHVLWLSNGGMRAQSWVFIAFPALFWASVSIFIVGTVLLRRATRGWTRQHRALALLRARRPATTEHRQRSLALVGWLMIVGVVLGVVSMAFFRSAPKTEDVVRAQTVAGAWRLHVEEMRDDQRLIVFLDDLGDGKIGDAASVAEAESIVREEDQRWAAEEAEAQYRCADSRSSGSRSCGEQAAMRRIRREKPQALSKLDAEKKVAEATIGWQSELSALNDTTIPAVVLGLLLACLLLFALHNAPRTVAQAFRGVDPEVEDPLFTKYGRLGNVALGLAALLLAVGVGCANGDRPDGASFGAIGFALIGIAELIAIRRILSAPLVLARVRNPQLASAAVVAAHDRTVLAEVAKLDAQAAAKRQYALTLQAAASPPDLVAAAQAEVAQLQGAAAHERSRLLGDALRQAQARVKTANEQRRALQMQRAPKEAFASLDAGVHAAQLEIARLAGAAGWVPWPLQPYEGDPSSGTGSDAAPSLSRRTIVIAAAVVLGIGTLFSVVAIRKAGSGSGQSSSTSTQMGAPAPEHDARCDSILDDYQRVLSMAGDSADTLSKGGCATAGADGTLVPPPQLSPQCQTAWTNHLVNAQRAIDLNGQARSACPSMNIPSMGSLPPSLRIDPKSISHTSDPWAPGATAAATTPTTAGAPSTSLDVAAVQQLVNAQAISLTTDTVAFDESFANDAIAFFPHALEPLEGRGRRAGSLDFAGVAIEHGSSVETAPVVVGISGSIAWAATTWTLTGVDKTVMPVRVTEVLVQGPTGLRVLAASFSLSPSADTTAITTPVPTLAGGVRAGDGPESWLASPVELSKRLLDDALDESTRNASSVFGSDANETAVGVPEVRKLLLGWKSVKLEIVGNVRVIESEGFRIVLEFARWRGPKPTVFRVLGVFVPGTGMVGPAPWQLAAAQYSVAVPRAAQPAGSTPGSTCTIAALNCTQFSTRGQTGKKLHALVFAAEQAGRHAEAICLARPNLNSSDKWLAGAANFEASRAWDGLGCHEQAIAAIETSLALRPRDQGGWNETCEQCQKIGGTCASCSSASVAPPPASPTPPSLPTTPSPAPTHLF